MYDKKVDFSQLYRDFSWDNELSLFSKDISKGFNFSHEVSDRYAATDKVAINWEGADGQAKIYSHEELSKMSDQVALLLHQRGVGPGDRVATLMPRIPELYATLLGIWKIGAVYVPLFTAFGPEAITYRLEHSETRFLIVHENFRANVGDSIKGLEGVFVVQSAGKDLQNNDIDFHSALLNTTGKPQLAVVQPDDLAIILYTSGSTGNAQGSDAFL